MRLIRSNKDTLGVKVNPLDVEKKSHIIGFPQLESPYYYGDSQIEWLRMYSRGFKIVFEKQRRP